MEGEKRKERDAAEYLREKYYEKAVVPDGVEDRI
jgi:hypothetical protein